MKKQAGQCILAISLLFVPLNYSALALEDETIFFRLESNPQLENLNHSNTLVAQNAKITLQDVSGQKLQTGKSATQAALMSILPGGGQFYNGDFIIGAIFLAASVGLIVLDNFVPFIGLAGFPGMSILSAIHAGLTTQEEIEL